MNDKWLNDIQRRLADFETDEPCGLWNDIESRQKLIAADRLRRKTRLWIKRCCSIAAVAIIAVIVGVTFMHEPEQSMELAIELSEQKTSVKEASATDNEPESSLDEKTAINGNRQKLTNLLSENIVPDNSNDVSTHPVLEIEDIKQSMADNETDEDSNVIRHNDATEESTIMNPAKRQHKVNPQTYSIARRKLNHRMTFGIFTSGSPTHSSNNQYVSPSNGAGIGTNGMIWEGNPKLGILLFNQGKDVETDIKHRLPIRTGLTLTYSFGDRIALESGLTYTNLTSDIKDGSDVHYMSGEQVLHYIGIPVNVKYRALSWKFIDIYASAGFLAEKCVSGKTSMKYYIDNKPMQTEHENRTVKPLQWSANASMGMQFNINKTVGLYAEPGISYYFDNGSDIKTIYGDKPLNFNLNVGLRFRLND